MTTIARVLTIAGSDSGGGAGIEADLKTFTALGVYGMVALTSVTAQNTVGVTAIADLSPELVAAQLDAVASDIGADALKTGMLSHAAIIETVADRIRYHQLSNLVIDPVMVAKSGDALLQPQACACLKEVLLPLAKVVTPNIPEAEALTGLSIATEEAVYEAARRIHAMGPAFVLIKGGHLVGVQATDYLFDGSTFQPYSSERINTRHTHGTGCTYSAAIAAYLGKGFPVAEAVFRAKTYVTGAIRQSFALGAGHGPLNHFWYHEPGLRCDQNQENN